MLRKLLLKLLRVTPEEQVRYVLVARLPDEVFKDLRHRVGGAASCITTSQTTDIQAGYMLGINHVLNIVQEGFTLPRA